MDCSPPGSSVHGIHQARILEWVAISFSRIFLTQGSNPGFSVLQADVYHLTYYGSPRYRGGNDKLEVLRHKGKPWRKGKQWHLPMGLVRVLVPKFFNLLVIVNLSWKMASTGTVWKSFLKTSYPLWVYCEPVRMSWSWRGVSIYDLKIEFYMSVYRERLRLARYHSTTWQCLTGGQYNPFISGQYDAHLKGSKIYEVLFCVLVMIDSSNYFSVYIL